VKSTVFVDTGGWVALQVPDDRWHAAAADALREASARRLPLLTSNHVVGETYTVLRMSAGHAAAWRFVDTVRRSTLLEIASVDDPLEDEAWALLRKYGDQAFSFVDGTSFALMASRRVRHALAFDKHFAAAGFTRVGLDGSLP
jgi:predicted nucleic acid-binding protein